MKIRAGCSGLEYRVFCHIMEPLRAYSQEGFYLGLFLVGILCTPLHGDYSDYQLVIIDVV